MENLSMDLFLNWASGLQTSDYISMIALLLSIITIILNKISNNKTNKISEESNQYSKKALDYSRMANELTQKINSKEHEITENLKYFILQFAAVIKAIDSKAALMHNRKAKIDISYELELLRKLQTEPEYQIFLISFEEDVFLIEYVIRILENSYSSPPNIRYYTHVIIDKLKDNKKFDDTVKNFGKIDNLVDFTMCLFKKEGIFTMFDPDANKKESEDYFKFITYLVEKEEINDPDVLLSYSVHYNKNEMFNIALADGGRIDIAASEIINKYRTVYQKYIKQLNQESDT